MKTRKLKGLKIEDGSTGEVSAVFSTFNAKDSDGDVTVSGAFKDGQEVRMSAYGHQSWRGALPIGKGRISQDHKEATFEGRFFLDTQAGQDSFIVVKELGDLQEWSYGYDVLDEEKGEFEGEEANILKSIDVHEVSPVLIGAGENTRTTGIKSNMRLTEHFDEVLTSVDEVTNRAAEVMATRSEKGKSLGQDSSERLAELKSKIEGLVLVLQPEPEPIQAGALEREIARYERRR